MRGFIRSIAALALTAALVAPAAAFENAAPATVQTDAPLPYRYKLWIPPSDSTGGHYKYITVNMAPTGLNVAFESPSPAPAISSGPLKAVGQ